MKKLMYQCDFTSNFYFISIYCFVFTNMCLYLQNITVRKRATY